MGRALASQGGQTPGGGDWSPGEGGWLLSCFGPGGTQAWLDSTIDFAAI